MKKFRFKGIVEAEQIVESGTVKLRNGTTVHANKGDWLVFNGIKEWLVTAVSFHNTFEDVSDQESAHLNVTSGERIVKPNEREISRDGIVPIAPDVVVEGNKKDRDKRTPGKK